MHIDELKLEMFILSPERLDLEETDQIKKHLESCELCKEHFENLVEYYEEVSREIKNEPTEADKKLVDKIFADKKELENRKLLKSPRQVVQVYDRHTEIVESKPPSLIQKWIHYAKSNPVKTAATFTFVFALLTFASINIVRPTKPNPVFAKIENRILYVYDDRGEIVWTKNLPGFPDSEGERIVDQHNRHVVVLEDIDGDATREVLINGQLHNEVLTADTLYCYNDDGSLRWKIGGGDFPDFNTSKWRHTKWFFADFFTVKSQNKKPLFFAYICDRLYAPSKLIQIEPKTGKIINNYYHAGHITSSLVDDFNDDGKPEIFLGGINSAKRMAFITVLDPNNIYGYGVATEEYYSDSLSRETARPYVLFPKTEAGIILGDVIYNKTDSISETEKGVIAYVQDALDVPEELHAGILYNLNTQMKVDNVVLAVTFTKNYEKLLEQGKVTEPLDSMYLNKLRDNVIYHYTD